MLLNSMNHSSLINRFLSQGLGLVISVSLFLTGPIAPFAEASERNKNDSFWKSRQLSAGRRASVPEQCSNAFNIGKRPLPLKEKSSPHWFEVSHHTPMFGPKSWRRGNTVIPFVTIIQDAHDNDAAQLALSRTLTELAQKEKPLLVCVEGAWGPLSTDIFNLIQNETERSKMAEELLRGNIITGEEYVSITSPDSVKLIGVENPDLHRKNTTARILVESWRRPTQNRLHVLQMNISRIERVLFPPSLLKLNRIAKEYQSGQITAPAFACRLQTFAPGTWWTENLPNIKRLSLLESSEKPSPQLQAELKRLFSTLSKDGRGTDDLLSLMANRLETDPTMAVQAIKNKIDQIQAYRQLDIPALAQELEEAPRLLARKLISDRPAQEKSLLGRLIILDEWLILANRMMALKMTPEDWTDFNQLSKTKKITDVSLELDALAQANRIKIFPLPRVHPTNEDMAWRAAKAFYRLAIARNVALAKNTLAEAKKHKKTNVVLIVGGFHYPGITRLLRNHQSYNESIRPNFTVDLSRNSKTTLRRMSGFQPPQTELRSIIRERIGGSRSTSQKKWTPHFFSNWTLMLVRVFLWCFLVTAVHASGLETIVSQLPDIALFTTALADPILQRMLNPRPRTLPPADQLRENEEAFDNLKNKLIGYLENNQINEAVALMEDVLSYSDERGYLLFYLLESTQDLREKGLQSRLISAMPLHSQRLLINGFPEVKYQTYRNHVQRVCQFMDTLGELTQVEKQGFPQQDKKAINGALPGLKTHLSNIRDILEELNAQERYLRPFAKTKPELPPLQTGNTRTDQDSFLFRKAVPLYNARVEAIRHLTAIEERISKFHDSLVESALPPVYGISPLSSFLLPKKITCLPISPLLEELERKNGPKERFKNELFDLTNPLSSYQRENEDWIKTITLTYRRAMVDELNPDLVPQGRGAQKAELKTRKIENFSQRMGRGVEDLSLTAQAFLESPEGIQWSPQDSPFQDMIGSSAEMTLPRREERRATVVVPSAANKRGFAEDFARTLRSQRPVKVVYVDLGVLLATPGKKEALNSIIEGLIVEAKERGDVLLMVDLDGLQGENMDSLIRLMNVWNKENTDNRAPPLLTLCTEKTFNTHLQGNKIREALTSNAVRARDPKKLNRTSLDNRIVQILSRTGATIQEGGALDKFLETLGKIDLFDIADRAALLISELGEKIHGARIRKERDQSEITDLDFESTSKGVSPQDLPLPLRVEARLPSMPENVRKSAIAKLNELQDLLNNGSRSESTASIRRYLEKLLLVPWDERAPSVIPSHLSPEERDAHVSKLFQELHGNIQKTHYGLDENVELAVKDILIKIVQSDLQRDQGGEAVPVSDIPTFVGPPGAGKTTLLQKLGELTGRPVILISMNLIQDATSFRGTSPTFMNSKEGRLATTLISGDPNNVRNPIIVCDEVDKSAPEVQSILLDLIGHRHFQDNYLLDVPIDECTFVFTANTLDSVISALLNRMDIIPMRGYTLDEKTGIALRRTLPRALRDLHLKKQIRFDQPADVMGFIACHYAREEGMRNFIRKLDEVLVNAFLRFLETGTPTTIDIPFVQSVLGDPLEFLRVPESDLLGAAAYPSLAGDLIDVHATGKSLSPPLATRPKFQTFANLVTRVLETQGIAWAETIKQQFQASTDQTPIKELQLDVPRVVPEDSASQLSLAIAGLSKATGVLVRRETAFVGELDLNGNLREANEIRKRVLTAYDAGARVMVLPHQNKEDMLFRTFSSVLALRGPALEPPIEDSGPWTLYLPKSYKGHFQGGDDPSLDFSVIRGTKEELLRLAQPHLYPVGGGVRCLFILARNVKETIPFAFVQPNRVPFKLTTAPFHAAPDSLDDEGEKEPKISPVPPSEPINDYHIPPWSMRIGGEDVDIRATLLQNQGDPAVSLAKNIIENSNKETLDEDAAQLEALARYSLVQSKGGALIDFFLGMEPSRLTGFLARMSPETIGALIHDKKADRFFSEIPRWEESLNKLQTALVAIKSGSINEETVRDLRDLTARYELFPPLIDENSKTISISQLRAAIDAYLRGPASEKQTNLNHLKSELGNLLESGRKCLQTYQSAGSYSVNPAASNKLTNLMDERFTEQSIFRRLLRAIEYDPQIPTEAWNAYRANESLQKDSDLENLEFISIPPEVPADARPLDAAFNGPASRFVELMARDKYKSMTLTGCPPSLKHLFASYLLKRLWGEGLPYRMIKIDVMKVMTSPADYPEPIESKWERLGPIIDAAGKAGNIAVWVDLDEIPEGTPPFIVSRLIQLLSQGPCSTPILFTGKEFTHRSLVDTAPIYAQNVVGQSINMGNPRVLWNLEIVERQRNRGLKIAPAALEHLSLLVERGEIGLPLARKILDRTQTTAGIISTPHEIDAIQSAIKTEADQSLHWATLWDKFESVSPQMSPGARRQAVALLGQYRTASGDEAATIEKQIRIMIEFPWGKRTPSSVTRLPANPSEEDLARFYKEVNKGIKDLREALDRTHHGMDDVKNKIIQYFVRDSLARAYTGKGIGKPLLLVSSPGQGKTSIGSAIADGLKRPFKKIALGAMSRIEELVGFSSMYRDSDTGKIMKTMVGGVLNPVTLLDEIDKMEKGIKGNPIDALLSYIDPAQNEAVEDEFSQSKYPFNEVLFIAAANSIDNIPGPVLDRFEVIHLPPYTGPEKVAILKRHSLPDLLKKWSVGSRVVVGDVNEVVDAILEYVREHGVRKAVARLSKTIGRALVASYLTGTTTTLRGTTVRQLLRTIKTETIENPLTAMGAVNGLAYSTTTNEGVLLPIQAILHNMGGAGRFEFEGFGLMGETMRPSLGRAVENALKRAHEMNGHLGDLAGHKLSVVLGQQGVETDGDSAGATFYFAVLSALTGIPVRQDVAMTGAISSGPSAMRVGAINGKISAAINEGMKTIFLPEEVKDVVGNIVRSNGTSMGLVEDLTEETPSQVLRIPPLLWREGIENLDKAKQALLSETKSADLNLAFEGGAALITGKPENMDKFFSNTQRFPRPPTFVLFSRMSQIEDRVLDKSQMPPSIGTGMKMNGIHTIPLISSLLGVTLLAMGIPVWVGIDTLLPWAIAHAWTIGLTTPILLISLLAPFIVARAIAQRKDHPDPAAPRVNAKGDLQLPDSFQWSVMAELNELAETTTNEEVRKAIQEIVSKIDANASLSAWDPLWVSLFPYLRSAAAESSARDTLATLLVQANPDLAQNEIVPPAKPTSLLPDLKTQQRRNIQS